MTRQPISATFADRARREPDSIVVCDRGGPATAEEVDVRATQVARLLLKHGVRRDDRVVVSLPNGIGFVVACVAIWRVGATPMPLSPDLPEDERLELEDLARPTAAFGPTPLRSSTARVSVDRARSLSTAPLPDLWSHSWKAPATSGSTGRPKVIVSTAPALVDPDAPVAPFVPRQVTQLVSSPMWHSTAFTYAFRGLTSGHRLVIEPEFDEYAFPALVERHRVGWAVLSPPSIRRLLRLPRKVRDRHDLTSLESVLHLGGRCSVPDKRALIRWLDAERVVEVYAGSESNGLTMIDGAESLRRPGSVGRPVGGTEIRILREDGAAADTGELGAIWMRRGPSPAYTYLGAPSRRSADGWDTLGDIGYLDDDGYLFVVDRAADTIRRDGTTVYPADIEQVVEEHPGVRGAVAVGSTDGAGAPTITVVVDIADADVTVSDLYRFTADRLPPTSRPDRIHLTQRPLRNDAGKIRRRLFAGHGRSENPTPTLRMDGAPA